MTKINKKCVECKQYIEQVFCRFDYCCEHSRIQAKERRVPQDQPKKQMAKRTSQLLKANNKISKCKGNGKSLIAVPLTIF